jgi:hypothetical protein
VLIASAGIPLSAGAGYCQSSPPGRLRAGAAKAKFYYERYLAHWLLQYGLLLLNSGAIDDWQDNQEVVGRIAADLTEVLEEFILTEEFRSRVITDFAVYVDQLVDYRFRHEFSGQFAAFRSDFFESRGLVQPADLLSAIRQADYFRLSARSNTRSGY